MIKMKSIDKIQKSMNIIIRERIKKIKYDEYSKKGSIILDDLGLCMCVHIKLNLSIP